MYLRKYQKRMFVSNWLQKYPNRKMFSPSQMSCKGKHRKKYIQHSVRCYSHGINNRQHGHEAMCFFGISTRLWATHQLPTGCSDSPLPSMHMQHFGAESAMLFHAACSSLRTFPSQSNPMLWLTRAKVPLTPNGSGIYARYFKQCDITWRRLPHYFHR